MFQRGYGEGMTRHLSLVARHRYPNVPHMSGLSPHQWKTRQRCKACRSKGLNGSRLVVLRPQCASAFGPIVASPSHKMLVKKPVQGLSYCSGIRAVVGMEPSASNERLDFALA